MTFLDCGGRKLDLSRTAVMGILNVTPDSFSDGGVFCRVKTQWRTRGAWSGMAPASLTSAASPPAPGAQAVSVQQELDRVIPVIEVLRNEIPVPISVDTAKPEVMRAAIAAGAGFINDVQALRAEGALTAAAALNVPVCLMHMRGEPRTMQDEPRYADVVGEVRDFLKQRLDACVACRHPARASRDRSGFGFGKTLEHNLALLRGLREFTALGVPVLAGLSRKSMIGKALGLPVGQRLHASVALALLAVQNGASIVRTHDVGPTLEAIRMLEAAQPPPTRNS